ncbi:MAG: heavy metal-responsive transcriptional regulator, partial [Planctomycetota bacterium]
RIGQIAKESGVGIETIRFYEREGLLPAPPRDPESGYRAYPREAVDVLLFVRRAKDFGFTLKEIAQLLKMQGAGHPDCSPVCAKASEKVEEIGRQIEHLTKLRESLVAVINSCSGRGPIADCQILHALTDKELPVQEKNA